MAKGKGGTTNTQSAQQIDPTMRKEASNLMDLFKLLASTKPEASENVDIAAFTPKQQASFNMGNQAAQAFGFTPAPPATRNVEADYSDLGIKGYASGKEANAAYGNMGVEYRAAMDQFYDRIGKTFKDKKPKNPSTGGKK